MTRTRDHGFLRLDYSENRLTPFTSVIPRKNFQISIITIAYNTSLTLVMMYVYNVLAHSIELVQPLINIDPAALRGIPHTAPPTNTHTGTSRPPRVSAETPRLPDAMHG